MIQVEHAAFSHPDCKRHLKPFYFKYVHFIQWTGKITMLKERRSEENTTNTFTWIIDDYDPKSLLLEKKFSSKIPFPVLEKNPSVLCLQVLLLPDYWFSKTGCLKVKILSGVHKLQHRVRTKCWTLFFTRFRILMGCTLSLSPKV